MIFTSPPMARVSHRFITALPVPFGRVTNQPPGVYAGPDTTNVFGTLPGTVQLAGSSWDDGLPRISDQPLVGHQQSTGASVTFSNATVTNTTATFSLPGTYTLQIGGFGHRVEFDRHRQHYHSTAASAPTVLITNPRTRHVQRAGGDQLMSIARTSMVS